MEKALALFTSYSKHMRDLCTMSIHLFFIHALIIILHSMYSGKCDPTFIQAWFYLYSECTVAFPCKEVNHIHAGCTGMGPGACMTN